MAFRIAEQIVSGWIDNTRRGRVRGELVLLGRTETVKLDFQGDCWRDLAGCRCEFRNPTPDLGDIEGLASQQHGQAGDMTASRKVRVSDLPFDEWYERRKAGLDVQESWSNSLYLEWFSENNGRVIIESADFKVIVSTAAWKMTPEEEEMQRSSNAEEMHRFLERLEQAIKPDRPARIEGTMDEFEWERFLRESDAHAERFGELLDKHGDSAESQHIIAREMGWELPEEQFDGAEVAWDSLLELDDPGCWDLPEPDPAREGVDWVREDTGHLNHPLVVRSRDLAVAIHSAAKDEGLFEFDADMAGAEAVRDLVKYSSAVSAKLAGGLGGGARGIPAPTGMVVATLKRATGQLHQALNVLPDVEESEFLEEQLPIFRQELFAVREIILKLIAEWRDRP